MSKQANPDLKHIAFKYRLYPTPDQIQLFIKTFGCCRKVYNLMLADKNAYYSKHHTSLSVTPAMYKQDYPYLKEVDSLALTNVQLNLQTAYTNHFRDPKKFGLPKFKSKRHSRNAYTTNNQHGTVALSDNSIKLPKVGTVKAVIHRKPEPDWVLKSATVSMNKDGTFYVSVLFEYEKHVTDVSKQSKNAIGLDYKSDGLYTDSNGNTADLPKWYRNNEKKLAKLQRQLSRKHGYRKGETESSNYKKQKQKIAKLSGHLSNQRRDTLHKLSTEIANQYDIVCIESLNMKSLANKGFGNGKATLDNGYGLFQVMLEYKLRNRGKYLIQIDKWYPSSQICHCCGFRQKLELKERIYQCPNCGVTMDRDYNAAVNILNEGLRELRELA